MTKNKFSTRLERKESKVIVSIFEKRCRKRKLSLILPVLDSIEQHYVSYPGVSMILLVCVLSAAVIAAGCMYTTWKWEE